MKFVCFRDTRPWWQKIVDPLDRTAMCKEIYAELVKKLETEKVVLVRPGIFVEIVEMNV